MPNISLDLADAMELGQLLEFLDDWLATAPDQLAPSLARFIDAPGYDLEQLRTDLQRHMFLLGHSDGEDLFQHDNA